jgi:hypothetical protein
MNCPHCTNTHAMQSKHKSHTLTCAHVDSHPHAKVSELIKQIKEGGGDDGTNGALTGEMCHSRVCVRMSVCSFGVASWIPSTHVNTHHHHHHLKPRHTPPPPHTIHHQQQLNTTTTTTTTAATTTTTHTHTHIHSHTHHHNHNHNHNHTPPPPLVVKPPMSFLLQMRTESRRTAQ